MYKVIRNSKHEVNNIKRASWYRLHLQWVRNYYIFVIIQSIKNEKFNRPLNPSESMKYKQKDTFTLFAACDIYNVIVNYYFYYFRFFWHINILLFTPQRTAGGRKAGCMKFNWQETTMKRNRKYEISRQQIIEELHTLEVMMNREP